MAWYEILAWSILAAVLIIAGVSALLNAIADGDR